MQTHCIPLPRSTVPPPITAAELAEIKAHTACLMPFNCASPGSTHYHGCPCGLARLVAEVERLREMLTELTLDPHIDDIGSDHETFCHYCLGWDERRGIHEDSCVWRQARAYLDAVSASTVR